MDAHTIKKALMSYRKNVEVIQKRNWELEEMRTKLYEGGTSSFIKMPDGTPKDRSEVISEFVIKEHKILDEIDLLSKELEIVDNFIDKVIDNKEMIIDKYINGLCDSELCNKYTYSTTSIKRKINEQISLYSD